MIVSNFWIALFLSGLFRRIEGKKYFDFMGGGDVEIICKSPFCFLQGLTSHDYKQPKVFRHNL
jgi:hypothetical protein